MKDLENNVAEEKIKVGIEKALLENLKSAGVNQIEELQSKIILFLLTAHTYLSFSL
jgi:hypothetical protein